MKNLQRAFKAFHSLDHKFPINAALALLYIAEHEPCLKQDMEAALDFSSASGSRNTDYLCNSNRLKKPGMGFIVKEEAIEDRRHSVLTLTDKGRLFLQSIAP
jgi:DNA-binding MarR family transcriptional regulator